MRRLACGGNILAPGRPNRPIQFIDVRDLCNWIVHCLEEKITGIYNATGPEDSLTMQELLNTGIEVLQPKESAKLVWLDDNTLLKENLGAWIEMPLWIPENEPNSSVFSNICSAKAQAKGLTYRPLSCTIEDIYDWDKNRNAFLKAGLDKEKEKHILACSAKI